MASRLNGKGEAIGAREIHRGLDVSDTLGVDDDRWPMINGKVPRMALGVLIFIDGNRNSSPDLSLQVVNGKMGMGRCGRAHRFPRQTGDYSPPTPY